MTNSAKTAGSLFLLCLLAASAAGCNRPGSSEGSQGVKAGSAIEKPYVTTNADSVRFPVGQQWLQSIVPVVNTSHQPITLVKVVVTGGTGSGIGTVLKITKNVVAPNGAASVTVPMGEYHTYPPVAYASNTCHTQAIAPISGYIVAPGKDVRILTVYRAVHAGAFKSQAYSVTYRQAGNIYEESLPVGYTVHVKAGVPTVPLEPWEVPCTTATTHQLPPLRFVGH